MYEHLMMCNIHPSPLPRKLKNKKADQKNRNTNWKRIIVLSKNWKKILKSVTQWYT